jgi:hypothetical protein
MDRIPRLFLWLTIIGPLHMAEQMMTSLEEFHMLRDQAAIFYGWFRPDQADLASVILITVSFTTAMLAIYAVLRGGAAARAAMYVFGVFAITELHHLVEAVRKGGYDPGLVTCFAFAIVGALMVRAIRATPSEAAPAVLRPPVYTLGR